MKNNTFHIDFRLNDTSFSSVEELIDFSKTLSLSTNRFFVECFSDSEYIEVQTSGSTGKPKIIQLKKEFMRNSALATGEFFNLFGKTSVLLCMSTDYIAGKMMLVRALTLGWHIDIVEPISNPLKELKKEYDFSAMVPMQLKNSLSDIHKIKKLIIGGGVVTQELEMQLQSISTEVYATFGMTETCTHIAVKKLNQFTNIDSNTSEKLHYKVLPNVSISQDHRNCLVINASKIAENQIVTNDIVEIVSETEFKWLGRFDTVINSGGVKLHPEEIEKKLSKIITQRFFVAGVPDKVLGEKLILVIEENITSKAVEEFLKIQLMSDFRKIKNITNYEIPKEIHFVENFIETETKKIQRVKMLDTLLKTN